MSLLSNLGYIYIYQVYVSMGVGKISLVVENLV